MGPQIPQDAKKGLHNRLDKAGIKLRLWALSSNTAQIRQAE
jgi:hypothetical protein